MGKAKLKMEYMINAKKRNGTFKKRKEGLIKKMHELTTLCDIKACAIIYNGPNQEEREIWPPNSDEFRGIIDMYKAKSKDHVVNSYGLSDFFNNRKQKVEEDLSKLRRKNIDAKYPSWDESLNALSEPELRQFAVALSRKAEYVKSRIELLKREMMGHHDTKLMDSGLRQSQYWGLVNQQQGIPTPSPTNEMLVPPFYYPAGAIDQPQIMNQNNPLMMMLMNGNSNSNSIDDQMHHQQMDYVNQNNSMLMMMLMNGNRISFGEGLMDPMIWGNAGPAAGWNGPPPSAFMQSEGLQFLSTGDYCGGQEDSLHY